jgi:NAD+ kinase
VSAYRSVGICLKPGRPDLGPAVKELREWLEQRGHEVLLDREAAASIGREGLHRHELAEKVDLGIVLGGDGTLLAVARAFGPRAVPILGINLGTLGFMAAISRDELFPRLEEVLAGRYEIELRMRLDVRVVRAAGGEQRFLALNDAVISNSALSRMVDLEMIAGGISVTTYHADGLILATPTGSTAYSLSAGGPLLPPGFEAMLVTPICPHTLSQRPLVLAPETLLTIRVLPTRGGELHLTVDGQVGCELAPGDAVQVSRSEHPARMLVPPGRNPFEMLRQKLHWGAR